MGIIARLKSTPGGGPPARTVTSAGIGGVQTLQLADDTNFYRISETATVSITAISTPNVQPGRQVTLICHSNVAVTFVNATGTTTSGRLDLGGTDIVLLHKQSITLIQEDDGTWRFVSVSSASGGSETGVLGADVPASDGTEFLLIAGDGVTEVATITVDPAKAGRILTIVATGSSNLVLVNNSNTTTSGQMDLRHSNRTVTPGGTVTLVQLASGAWRLVAFQL